MKKLLLINWRDRDNPEAGGAEIYYHEIFRRLAARGFHVTVLSHYFPGAKHEEHTDGMTIIRKGGKFLFNYEIIPWILKNRSRFDLVIEDLNKIPFFTPLYCKSKRLHLAMHFFAGEIFRETIFPLALYVYCMEKFAAFIYRKERFVAISESTAQDLEKFPVARSRISIVEPGIDTAFYKPTQKKSDPPVISHIGRLMKYKNIQFIIRCIPSLVKQHPGLVFEVGGGGDYRSELEKLASRLGVEKHVRFLGRISDEEKCNLLSRSSLFVNPSSKEGWGINNIEANLCGTVSLSSNVHGLRDSVIDQVTGLLYKPDNIDDFCSKALRLLSDVTYRETMEQAAKKRALDLDWDAVAGRMQQVLTTVI